MMLESLLWFHCPIQGYLFHERHPPPRTLQEGPIVVQGGGGLFLMSEVPLYTLSSDLAAHRVGASLEARATVGS